MVRRPPVCYGSPLRTPPLRLAMSRLLTDSTPPMPSQNRHAALLQACAAMLGLMTLTGCQLWPWNDNERTSIITPAMRVASIREIGARADDAASADQLSMCEELAQQIRTEPDPIVRRAIQESIAKFDAPLASAVLIAGLNDDDRDVRTACCRLLGNRKDPQAVQPLSRIVGAEADMEVRMAAIDALGKYESTDAVVGLAAAIKDRDPALQYAGVKAMKSASGKDLGNDVEAWRQYAATLTPTSPSSPMSGSEVNIARTPSGEPGVR
jgi:HEAT repeat protein